MAFLLVFSTRKFLKNHYPHMGNSLLSHATFVRFEADKDNVPR